jgi:REP element-mobilizing transposase RayT
MPQSLSRILLHLIFSTKNRASYFTDPAIRNGLHGYLAATTNHLGCSAIRVGGVADHVHVVCSLGRTLSVATFVAKLKVSSNLAVRERYSVSFLGRMVTQHTRYPNRLLSRSSSMCPTKRHITRRSPSKTNIGHFYNGIMSRLMNDMFGIDSRIGARGSSVARIRPEKDPEPILARLGGPFRAKPRGGEFPRVNPWLSYLGRFGPQISATDCPTVPMENLPPARYHEGCAIWRSIFLNQLALI